MKVEWPGDLSYLLRENRISLISCVVSDESYFLKRGIYRADHCVCCCASYILLYLGGPVVVGSELATILLAMLLSYS